MSVADELLRASEIREGFRLPFTAIRSRLTAN